MDPPLEGSRIRTIGTAWRDQGFQRGSSRLCSISCQRKSWRERQPILRRRRAPSAGPIVRILFPPAKSLRTFRSLLESPRTPAVIVEAPVNGTDAASPLQRVAVPPDPRPQRVRHAAVPDRVGCCGARLCRKLPLSPSARRGRSLLAFACRAAARSNRRAGRGPPRDRHARARALKPLQPQSGGLPPEEYMQRCDPRPLNPNGELLLGISSAGLRSSGSIGSGARTLPTSRWPRASFTSWFVS